MGGMFSKKNKVEAAADPPEVDEAGGAKDSTPKAAEVNKGISKIDLVMRIVAAIATLASAVAMATTNQSFPVFTQFINFKAQFAKLPTFTFFVVINCIVCGYLVLSLALSIFHIFKSAAKVTRVILIVLDTVMMACLTAGASAVAGLVQLAHERNGNAGSNWFAICQQNNSFCERASGSLVGSFMAVLMLVLLILLSAVALSRQ